jgi:ankyrin repeat protein
VTFGGTLNFNGGRMLENIEEYMNRELEALSIKFHSSTYDVYGLAFVKACYEGELRGVNYFLNNPNLDIDKHIAGWTPLCIACAQGHKEMVELLIEEGNADVNIQTTHGWSPLHIACCRYNNDDAKNEVKNTINIIGYLMNRDDINLSLQDNDGFTVLDIALLKEAGFSKSLEEHGAESNNFVSNRGNCCTLL